MKPIRISVLLILSMFLVSFSAPGWAARDTPRLKTPAEASAYSRYTLNDAVAAFLSSSEAAFSGLEVRIVGRSRPVEDYEPRDLFLAVITEEGAGRPEEMNRDKPTVFFIGSQHGNEQSAKEAALRLIRDTILGDLRPLLKKVNILIMPQANPYGNRFDLRVNELKLDMNRDHVKLETEGVRAIHRVFREWMPEVTIDIHEKGDDYYRVSIGCVSNANIDAGLQDYSRQVILSEVENALRKKNVTFHEYLITERLGADTSSGAAIPQPARSPEIMMRYSTSDLNDGRNSLGIFETLAFIQEGASRHDIQTLEARTEWQYQGLRSFLESVAGHATEIKELVRSLRRKLIEKAQVYGQSDLMHLKMAYVRDPSHPELELKAFERTASPYRGVLKVDKKAGDLLQAGDIEPYRASAEGKIVSRIIKNWFPLVEPRLSVARPLGYIISDGRLDIIETLLALGIDVDMIAVDSGVRVEAYRIKEVIPAAADYLAPEKIEVESSDQQILVKRGDFYISCAQPAANLIPCVLEPQSDYGFIRYRKFDLVPEPDDIFSVYRVVSDAKLKTIPYKRWAR